MTDLHSMTRRNFLTVSTAGGMASCLIGKTAMGEDVSRPAANILFINTDQQRKDTISCYGNTDLHTPHLDALAASGILFDSCYATQPVCSPCRSSMVTGLYPTATTVVENNIPLPSSLCAWPRELREAGYATAYIGKWHLGVEPVPEYFDLWRGYETGWKHFIKEEPFYAAPGQSDSAFRRALEQDPPVVPEEVRLIGKYRPDIETDYTIQFIRENRNSPFACWLSYYPPHTPKEAPEENIALYEETIKPREQAVYQAMVNRIDWNLGRLLAELETLGLRDNTLIVFTSDHGENYPVQWNNHHKRLCYDQSANVPLIISWPDVVPGGMRIRNVVSIADLCPTFLEVCGLTVPDGLHGESMTPLLAGETDGWRKEVYIQNSPYRTWEKKSEQEDPDMRERCVVTDDWKLILNTSRPPELFDRHAELPDTNNLFGKENTGDVARDLAGRMAAWTEKTGDAVGQALLEQWRSETDVIG